MAGVISSGDLATGGAIVEDSSGTKHAVYIDTNDDLRVVEGVDNGSPAVAIGYFNDSSPIDNCGHWAYDSVAFDGSFDDSVAPGAGTEAYHDNISGVGATHYLYGQGTNLPGTGSGTIQSVKFRV